jgi:integrase
MSTSPGPALEVHGDSPGQPQPGTIDWVVARYKEHLSQRVAVDNYDPKSLKLRCSYLDRFCRFIYRSSVPGTPPVRLGALELRSASQLHLTSWLITHFDRWKKGSTRADACGAVLGCFNWAEEKIIETSPFRRPREMKFLRTHRRAMRKHHYRAIMREARRHPGSMAFRLVLFFVWQTGVRLQEMRLLEWDEIDWEQGVVRLELGKNKTARSTGKQRIFGLGPRLLAVLWHLYQRRRAGQKRVFLTPRRRGWTKDNLGRHFARYRRLAGVPSWVMACGSRHGYAVRLIAGGEDTKAVADQLGHSSTRMIEEVYGEETRYDAEHVRGVAARAERGRKRSGSTPHVNFNAEQKKRERERKNFPLFEGLD